MKHSEGFERLAADAKTRIKEVAIDEVRAKQSRGENFHFIDVREDNEWSQGHAAGAQHIGRGVIERDIEQLVPDKNAELILYCGGGYRSALAADNLQRMGYKNVYSMDGGIRLWRAKGLPEET